MINNEKQSFTEFQLSSTGTYHPKDADFNYKDIPHLNIVHPYAKQILVDVGSEHYTAMHFQKVLFFRFPFILFNFSQPSSQTAIFSFLFYTIKVRNIWTVFKNKTKVETKYTIFSPKYLKFTHFILKKLISKNYNILMNDDIPIRLRRGHLRTNGYSFKHDNIKNLFYSDTLNLENNNLILPKNTNEKIILDLNKINDKKTKFYGDNGLKGLRVEKSNNKIFLYLRACPHEGACLDTAKMRGNTLICPWHGRLQKPIFTFDCLTKKIKRFTKNNYNLKLINNNLILTVQS